MTQCLIFVFPVTSSVRHPKSFSLYVLKRMKLCRVCVCKTIPCSWQFHVVRCSIRACGWHKCAMLVSHSKASPRKPHWFTQLLLGSSHPKSFPWDDPSCTVVTDWMIGQLFNELRYIYSPSMATSYKFIISPTGSKYPTDFMGRDN